MQISDKSRLANLSVILALFVLSAWYLWDSWRASTHVYNLIFVLPLTLATLALCSVAFLRELLAPSAAAVEAEQESEAGTLTAMSLFAGYVVTLPLLGFDVGTFVFLALFLWASGEKKWHWALGYSLVFASAAALFFSYMLPYPMPMLLLPGGS